MTREKYISQFMEWNQEALNDCEIFINKGGETLGIFIVCVKAFNR